MLTDVAPVKKSVSLNDSIVAVGTNKTKVVGRSATEKCADSAGWTLTDWRNTTVRVRKVRTFSTLGRVATGFTCSGKSLRSPVIKIDEVDLAENLLADINTGYRY